MVESGPRPRKVNLLQHPFIRTALTSQADLQQRMTRVEGVADKKQRVGDLLKEVAHAFPGLLARTPERGVQSPEDKEQLVKHLVNRIRGHPDTRARTKPLVDRADSDSSMVQRFRAEVGRWAGFTRGSEGGRFRSLYLATARDLSGHLVAPFFGSHIHQQVKDLPLSERLGAAAVHATGNTALVRGYLAFSEPYQRGEPMPEVHGDMLPELTHDLRLALDLKGLEPHVNAAALALHGLYERHF